MIGYTRRRHAAAAYALLARSMDGNATDGAWALSLAAERLRQYGDAGLAEQVEELADDWYPADSEIRAMMARVGELIEREDAEPSLRVIGDLSGITGEKDNG